MASQCRPRCWTDNFLLSLLGSAADDNSLQEEAIPMLVIFTCGLIPVMPRSPKVVHTVCSTAEYPSVQLCLVAASSRHVR